jgi:glyoxylase-like metal-dependent hydrolase (beta-lactamase superfamily II)
MAGPAESPSRRIIETVDAAGRSLPIDGDRVELAPGVTALASPGHTPGHLSIVVSSGTERAILLGDAVTCPQQLEEPDWENMTDVDPGLAHRTREQLWRDLAGRPDVAVAAHFPGLAFGRVLRTQRAYQFVVPELPFQTLR